MNNADPYRCSRNYMEHHYGYLKDAADQDKWLERYGHTLDAMVYVIEAQKKEAASPAVYLSALEWQQAQVPEPQQQTEVVDGLARAAEESRKLQQQICETCSFYDDCSSKVWHCKKFSILQLNCSHFWKRQS